MSLDDDLLRIFGSHKVAYVMEKLKLPEGEPIEHGMISRAIENAQGKVEAHNFDIRKHLIEYDDVMNRQREVIYTQRREVLKGENLKQMVIGIIDEMVEDMITTFCPEKTPSQQWNWGSLYDDYLAQFNIVPEFPDTDKPNLKVEELEAALKAQVQTRLSAKEEEFSVPVMEHLLRILLLQTIDMQWKGHLLNIDHLKEGIGLRSYAQRNPKEEYKREAYNLFVELMGRIRQDIIQKLFRIQLARNDDVARMEEEQRRKKEFLERHTAGSQKGKPVVRDDRIGRNDPCPCGSGKKYKKCCG
jgi:preprotein translocase subunit SecA